MLSSHSLSGPRSPIPPVLYIAFQSISESVSDCSRDGRSMMSLSVRRFLIEAVTFVLALTCVDETKHNERDASRQTAKIIVSNRVSSLDAIVLQRMIANHKCKLVRAVSPMSGR